jgi:hypothetical protein
VVQIVWSTRYGSREIEHLGSAHDEAGLAALKATAAQRLAAGQAPLDLGLAGGSEAEPLPTTSSNSAHQWDALCAAYELLGFEEASDGDGHSVSWFWRRSSRRPARPIRCVSSTRRAEHRCHIRP